MNQKQMMNIETIRMYSDLSTTLSLQLSFIQQKPL